jgi:hypothetical protein
VSPAGYTLLQCIRAYVELDLYMAFDVHTDDTLEEVEEQLRWFGRLIEVSYQWALS